MYTILTNSIFILVGIVLILIVSIVALSIICALLLSLAIYASIIKILLIECIPKINPLSKV